MIYRIYPSRDTVITNYKRSSVQQTGSNGGLSEVLPLFKIAGTSGSTTVAGSASLSRILIKFDFSTYCSLTASGDVPSTGVLHRIVLRDAKHASTLPYSYDIEVVPVLIDWDEGRGLDVDSFYDPGFANWVKAKSNVYWTSQGGDVSSSLGFKKFHFDTGEEDVSLDVTSYVNAWLTGGLNNNGLLVRMSSTLESNTEYNDYFVKKFHSRHTHFPDERPYIESYWDDSLRDDRNNFVYGYTGSLYLYNVVRGQLTNLTGIGTGQNVLNVRIVDLSGTIKSLSGSHTGQTGVYSASFAIASASYSGSTFSDVWGSASYAFNTASFTPLGDTTQSSLFDRKFSVNLRNLRNEYFSDEKVRFEMFVRDRDYFPSVVLTSSVTNRGIVVTKAYYRIDNDRTGETVISFGTGSPETTRLSYDEEGNYFDLYMSSLSRGNVYRIVFLFDDTGQRQVVDRGFKFRVV